MRKKKLKELLMLTEDILWWQTSGGHPLTCREHTDMSLYLDKGILKCHLCDYEQEHIPDVCRVREIMSAQHELMKQVAERGRE